MAKAKLKKRSKKTATPFSQKSHFERAVDFFMPTTLRNIMLEEGRKNRNNQLVAAAARSYFLEAEPLGVANLGAFNGNAPGTGYRSRIIEPQAYVREVDFNYTADTSQAIPVGSGNLAQSFLSGYSGHQDIGPALAGAAGAAVSQLLFDNDVTPTPGQVLAYGSHSSNEAKAWRQELATALEAYEQEMAAEAGTKSYAELVQKKASFMHWLDGFLRECEQNIKAQGKPDIGQEPSPSNTLWDYLNPLKLPGHLWRTPGAVASGASDLSHHAQRYGFDSFYNAVDQHLQKKLDQTRGLKEEFQLWSGTITGATPQCLAELTRIKQNYEERLLDSLSSLDNDPALVLDIKALRQQASQALQDCLKEHDPNGELRIEFSGSASTTVSGVGAATTHDSTGTSEMPFREHLLGTAAEGGRLAEVTNKAVQLRAEMNRHYAAPKGRMQQWRYEYDQEHQKEHEEKLKEKTQALADEVAKAVAAVKAPAATPDTDVFGASISTGSDPAPLPSLGTLDEVQQAYQGLKTNPHWLTAEGSRLKHRTEQLRAEYTAAAKAPTPLPSDAPDEQKKAYDEEVAKAKQAEANLARLDKVEAFYRPNDKGVALAELSQRFQTVAQDLARIQGEYAQEARKIIAIEHLYDPEQAKHELAQLEAKYKKQADDKKAELDQTNKEIQAFSVEGLDQSLKVQQQVFADQAKALTEAQERIFNETTKAAKDQRDAADKAYQDHYIKTRLYTLTHGPYPPPTKEQLKGFNPLQQLQDLDPDPTHNDRMSFGLVSVSKSKDPVTGKDSFTIHTHSGPGPNSAAHHDREGIASWSHIFSERWNRSSREQEVAATLTNPEKLDDIGLALECILQAKGGAREINNRFDGFTPNNYNTLIAIHMAAIARGIDTYPEKDFDASFKGEWVRQVAEGAPREVKKWILENQQRPQVRAQFLQQIERAKQNYRAAKEFNQTCTALLQGGIKPSGVTSATGIPAVFSEQAFQPYWHFLHAVQSATHFDSSTHAKLAAAGKASDQVTKALDETLINLNALNLNQVKGLMADGGDIAGHSAAVLGLVLEKNSALRVLAIKEREIIAVIEACHNPDNGLTAEKRLGYMKEARRASHQLLQDYQHVADLMNNQGLSVQDEVLRQAVAAKARIEAVVPLNQRNQWLEHISEKRLAQSLELGDISRACLVDRLQMQGLVATAALAGAVTIDNDKLATELPRLAKLLTQVQAGREVGNPPAKLPIEYLVTAEELKDLKKFMALDFATKENELKANLAALEANPAAQAAFDAAKKTVEEAQAKVDGLKTSKPSSPELYDAEKALEVAKRAFSEDPIQQLSQTLSAVSALKPMLDGVQEKIRQMEELLEETKAVVQAIDVAAGSYSDLGKMYPQAASDMTVLSQCKEHLTQLKQVALPHHQKAIAEQLQIIEEKRQAILTTVNTATASFATKWPEEAVLDAAKDFYDDASVKMTPAEKSSTQQKVPGMLYQKEVPVKDYLEAIEKNITAVKTEIATIENDIASIETASNVFDRANPAPFFLKAKENLAQFESLQVKLKKLEKQQKIWPDSVKERCDETKTNVENQQAETIAAASATLGNLFEPIQTKIANIDASAISGPASTKMYVDAAASMQALWQCKTQLTELKQMALPQHQAAIDAQLQIIDDKRQAILTTVNTATASFATQLPEQEVLGAAKAFYTGSDQVSMTLAERASTQQKVPGMLYQQALPVGKYLAAIDHNIQAIQAEIHSINAVATVVHGAGTTAEFFKHAKQDLAHFETLLAKLEKLGTKQTTWPPTVQQQWQEATDHIAAQRTATISAAKVKAQEVLKSNSIPDLEATAKFFSDSSLSESEKKPDPVPRSPALRHLPAAPVPDQLIAQQCNQRIAVLKGAPHEVELKDLSSRASFSGMPNRS